MSNILLEDYNFCDKLEAHKKGLKHFAFSVFLFNKDKLLIQKRAKNKYHSGGLWSNTCCSHFRNIDEFNNKENTIKNRLYEEIGLKYTNKLSQIGVFDYNEKVGNLIENEIDYIFIGFIEDDIKLNLNKEEVDDVKFIDIKELKEDIKENGQNYTIWLKLILNDKNINLLKF